MKPRHFAILATITAGLLWYAMPSHGGQTNPAKEALQELNDYIGGWKGNGTSEKDTKAIWKENCSWSWKFKGNDAWLVFEFKDSKFYKEGEMKYLTDKKQYELTVIDKAGKKLVFTGEMQKKKSVILQLERVDPDTKETQQLKFNTTNDGDRLNIVYWVKPANRTIFSKEWQIGMTREGVSLAGGKKLPECVVTGGLGTMTVSYKGQTYYVCCSGCRDAFNDNPEKIIKEYEAKKKKGG